jgi:hypothetical protein
VKSDERRTVFCRRTVRKPCDPQELLEDLGAAAEERLHARKTAEKDDPRTGPCRRRAKYVFFDVRKESQGERPAPASDVPRVREKPSIVVSPGPPDGAAATGGGSCPEGRKHCGARLPAPEETARPRDQHVAEAAVRLVGEAE